MQPLRIAVTGVPGCGKTSLCELTKFNTISVLDLAKKYGAIIPETINFDTVEIDVELLNKILVDKWKDPPKEHLLVDGHLSHNLPVNYVILMRCRPDVLEKRLKLRNWTVEKISENVESELLSSIVPELDENIRVLEIDTTNSSIIDLSNKVHEWVKGEKESNMLDIDWIKELHS